MSIQRDYRYFGGQPSINLIREFPEVDTTMFSESAGAFTQLLKDASSVLNKLAVDKEFAYKVMNAAQHSDSDKVEELVKSTGIKSDVTINFNPDEIILKFSAQVHGTDCCNLTTNLKW